MRHLSAIVLIGLLIVLPGCKYFKKGGSSAKKTSALLHARQDSIRVADSLRTIQEKLAAIETARIESEKTAEDERLAAESRLKYNIIIGSFITPENAKGLAEAYRNKGYNTRILKVEGSKFELVSAEGHESFRKAFNRLKEFQDTVNPDSWIFAQQ
jgi:hypothetical protein